jgi:hypothetical protein
MAVSVHVGVTPTTFVARVPEIAGMEAVDSVVVAAVVEIVPEVLVVVVCVVSLPQDVKKTIPPTSTEHIMSALVKRSFFM